MTRKTLTPKQQLVVEATLDGKSVSKTLKDNGWSTSRPGGTDVANAVAAARAELSSAAQIRRADVIEGFREAIDMARLSADPHAMIAGWREIGKMLGMYEPEQIKIAVDTDSAKVQRRYNMLSDEDLLEIVAGKATVLDGEFKRLERLSS